MNEDNTAADGQQDKGAAEPVKEKRAPIEINDETISKNGLVARHNLDARTIEYFYPDGEFAGATPQQK